MTRNTVSKYKILSAEQLISDWLGDCPDRNDVEMVAHHLYSQRFGTLRECRTVVAQIFAEKVMV